MARKCNFLTDNAIRNAKSKAKNYRLTDNEGLYLLVKTNGSKLWRIDYSFNSQRNTLSLGSYPIITLAEARKKAFQLKQDIAQGINPSEQRKELKSQVKQAKDTKQREILGLPLKNSFQDVAMQWHEKHMAHKSTTYQIYTKTILERDLFPYLGHKLMNDITHNDLIEVFFRCEQRSIGIAHKAAWITQCVFRYAIPDIIKYNLVTDIKHKLTKNPKDDHYKAIIDPIQFGKLLRGIDTYNGIMPVKTALQLAPLVFVRPGELCRMQWKDIDFDAHEWRYTVTKTKTPHIVPLSKQAINLLNQIKPLTFASGYVFQNNRKTITAQSLRSALISLTDKQHPHTPHGFRATARTLLDEQLDFASHLIAHQLAHKVKDTNGIAYNRTKHLKQRHDMMQV